MRFLGIILLLIMGALSCQQRDQIVVSKILVDRADGADAVFPDRSELRNWIKSGLSSHSNFKFREDSAEGSVLRVKVGASSFATSGSPSRIYVATQLLREDKGIVQQLQADTAMDLAPRELQSTFNKGLKENLDSIFSDLSGTIGLKATAVQTLKDYVSGTAMSEGEVATAIRAVAQEREIGAAPFLAKILKGRNFRLAVQALSALASIGSAESIEAITEFAERKSPELRRHAIEAVRRIGGAKAAAWLFTLSTGHSDEQVRESARLALIDVERRMKSSGSKSGARLKEIIAKN